MAFVHLCLSPHPVAKGSCFEKIWGVLWEKWGLLAFCNYVGLSGNMKGCIYVNNSICLPSTLYFQCPAVFVLSVLLFQRQEREAYATHANLCECSTHLQI